MPAGHTTLPLPTWVEVTNLVNGKRVVVKVNDRGPFVDNRLIDLSFAAATAPTTTPPGSRRAAARDTRLTLNATVSATVSVLGRSNRCLTVTPQGTAATNRQRRGDPDERRAA